MKIAITDANIYIDLIHIDLPARLFELDFEVHTSLEVFDELDAAQQKTLQPFIHRNLLMLHDGRDIPPIELVKSQKGLSESDKAVLYLAAHLEAFVLSGDGLVRKISGVQKIDAHGIFWLLDNFIRKKLITKKRAATELKKLMEFNRRLPLDECETRLKKWGG